MSIRLEIKVTIPNLLSCFRILLVPVFAVLYLKSRAYPALLYWSCAVLALSGLTDLFDGMIARRFNQITELGKLLDPVADKLTQVTVVLCLTVQHAYMIPLLIICVVKEASQAVGGLLLLHKGEKIQGAKWYGKVSTFVFYGAMALIVLFDLPLWLVIALVALVAVFMLFAFFNYMRMYLRLRRESLPQKAPDSLVLPEESQSRTA